MFLVTFYGTEMIYRKKYFAFVKDKKIHTIKSKLVFYKHNFKKPIRKKKLKTKEVYIIVRKLDIINFFLADFYYKYFH